VGLLLRPAPGMQFYVLDAYMELVPIGVAQGGFKGVEGVGSRQGAVVVVVGIYVLSPQSRIMPDIVHTFENFVQEGTCFRILLW